MSVHPGAAAVLRDLIGLEQVDESDPLHRRLADEITNAGSTATFGARVVALRWAFNWELATAGETLARAKADYERHVDQATLRIRGEKAAAGEKITRAEAEQIARASDEAYARHVAYLVAEQRERALRNFMQTLDAALDNHRTDRADQRAGDRASASGYDGAA